MLSKLESYLSSKDSIDIALFVSLVMGSFFQLVILVKSLGVVVGL
jgi:hypothetical protein